MPTNESSPIVWRHIRAGLYRVPIVKHKDGSVSVFPGPHRPRFASNGHENGHGNGHGKEKPLEGEIIYQASAKKERTYV